MGVVESLAAWGIVRPGEVVQIAAAAGLDLAAAATMLELESGGGHNLWGHDGVATGGFYVTGGEVTREAYLAWLPHRQRLGSQGVGPTQLTWGPLQDQADRLGGCWDWRINVTVGFRHLANLVQAHGLRNGFRAYNGSGPDAEAYADKAMRALQRWIVALPVPQPGQPLTPQQEDEMAFTEQEEGEILEAARSVVFGIEGQRGAGPMALSVADLRDRATDTARGIAVLVESVRNLTNTVEGMARLLAVSTPAPVPAAEIHYPTLVSEMLAKLGLPQQSTSERSPT